MEPPRWLEDLASEAGVIGLERAIHGDDLSIRDVEEMLREAPLHVLAAAADYYARKVKNGVGSYIVNLYLAYTNVCVTRCTFCDFYVPPERRSKGYLHPPERLGKVAGLAYNRLGVREIHMVGGNDPELPMEYYEEAVKRIKEAAPGAVLKAFTAEEIGFIAKATGNSVREVLDRLIAAGLDAMPGGGAEILSEDVRRRIAPLKISSDEFLEIHRIAHKMGLKSNITMLYAHIEDPVHVAEHIVRVRKLQEETGGFISFIPLRFNPGKTPLSRHPDYRKRGDRGGLYDLRIVAVARLALLGRIDNIMAYWISMGEKLAQAALSHGANDIGGTFYNESVISKASRLEKRKGMKPSRLAYHLTVAGWKAMERDTFYNYYQLRGEVPRHPWMHTI
ncbi:MAG: radical SAM protein [Desulfurococcales archaeon]|nr:radical SAM protein [Desulfurococcales archaeon]